MSLAFGLRGEGNDASGPAVWKWLATTAQAARSYPVYEAARGVFGLNKPTVGVGGGEFYSLDGFDMDVYVSAQRAVEKYFARPTCVLPVTSLIMREITRLDQMIWRVWRETAAMVITSPAARFAAKWITLGFLSGVCCRCIISLVGPNHHRLASERSAQQWTNDIVALDWYGTMHLEAEQVDNYWSRLRWNFSKGLWGFMGVLPYLSTLGVCRTVEQKFGRDLMNERVYRHSRALLPHVIACVNRCKATRPLCEKGRDDNILRTFMWSIVDDYIKGRLPDPGQGPGQDGGPRRAAEESRPRPELNGKLNLLMDLCCNAYFVETEYDVFRTTYEGKSY